MRARANWLVRLAYHLEGSKRYRRVKSLVRSILVEQNSPARLYVDGFMIVLVLASIFGLIYEVRHPELDFDNYLETFAVLVFFLDYVARLWVHDDAHRIVIDHYEQAEFLDKPFDTWKAIRAILKSKWEYMTTFMAIVDLLAIVPTYRPLRLLRIFLLFRLLKLFRYSRSISEFVSVLAEKRFELTTLLGFLGFVIFAASTAIYLFESHMEGGQIETMVDAIYWAVVTLSTVGYGDITPHTTEGRVVTLILITTGIGVLSFFTSIIVSAFTERMPMVKARRVVANLERQKGYSVVGGFGRVGETVARLLDEEGERFVIVDPDHERIDLAHRLGYTALVGDLSDQNLLSDIGVRGRVARVLCLTGSDVINLYATLSVRYLNPDIEIVARCDKKETERKLRYAGATHTVSPFRVAGLIAAEYLEQPVAFEAIYGVMTGHVSVLVDTVPVNPGSWLDGRLIGEISVGQQQLLVLGVIAAGQEPREHESNSYNYCDRRFHFRPRKSFRLHAGDMLVLIGHQLSLAHFRESVLKGGQ